MSRQFKEPLVASGYDSESVTRKISDIVLKRPVTRGWLGGFAIAFALLLLLNFAIGWLLLKGVGVWGVNIPVAWGFAIVNFVWWIGIGHAGTFISAILLLLQQDWRTSINRFAESMTLFAVACAGLFPLLHLGRPWVFYWLLPYPNTMDLWPQWRSPLVWDVFAVGTYLTVSLMFWYVGLLPDLATIRDRAVHRRCS
jgi:Ni/Fe-hydrogenase subunit HybB-like protein